MIHDHIFIHVPRTGGTTLRQLEWPGHNGHATALQTLEKIGPEQFWTAYKFAFIRHPLDRFVSLYHYFAQMSANHQWYPMNEPLIKRMQGYGSFRECCLRFIEDRTCTYYHLLPQADYVLIDGKMAVDYLGRTETLQDDIAQIAAILHAPRFRLRRQENRSQHRPWQEEYDPETTEIVSAHYAADFDLLNLPRQRGVLNYVI